MGKKNTETKTFGDFLAGKGFYIVLFACVAVIGVSAWVLLFTGDEAGTDVDYAPVSVVNEPEDDIPAVLPSGYGSSVYVPITPQPTAPSTIPPTAPPKTASPTAAPKPPAPPKESNGESGHENSSGAKTLGELEFLWPVLGDVGMGYAVDELVYSKTMGDWRTHPAIDISGALGMKVTACADGVVESIATDDMLGTTVVIDHGFGLKSVYANLAGTPNVETGNKVALGAVVGSIGDTALGETGDVTHLHFAMTLNGEPCSPLDYLPKR
ncbi:MAG: M23 family metallopeptidase [Oscillospiraceae bacterium]|jgi:murein DD-endopeptidase MepM/ murein hydrolase activator NlpD|nr:M23 family metallopeptidase [Oscillospiraceae bacterium]